LLLTTHKQKTRFGVKRVVKKQLLPKMDGGGEIMIKNDWIVCDQTGMILNDGVTLYSGYVEIKGNKLYRYATDDPMNEIAKYKPWVLHNKVENIKVASKEPCKNKKLQGKHFMSVKAMEKYLTQNE